MAAGQSCRRASMRALMSQSARLWTRRVRMERRDCARAISRIMRVHMERREGAFPLLLRCVYIVSKAGSPRDSPKLSLQSSASRNDV